MILIPYIIGVLCLIMCGMFISTIVIDKQEMIHKPTLKQYGFAIVGFILGNYLLIACIGKASH